MPKGRVEVHFAARGQAPQTPASNRQRSARLWTTRRSWPRDSGFEMVLHYASSPQLRGNRLARDFDRGNAVALEEEKLADGIAIGRKHQHGYDPIPHGEPAHAPRPPPRWVPP